MEKKQNKVVKFVSDHKVEIVIGLVSAVLGGTIAYGLDRRAAKTEYGKLIEVVSQFNVDVAKSGKSFTQTLTEFLDTATKGTYGFVANYPVTVADLGDTISKRLIEDFGVEPTAAVSGLMIGVKKEP